MGLCVVFIYIAGHIVEHSGNKKQLLDNIAAHCVTESKILLVLLRYSERSFLLILESTHLEKP